MIENERREIPAHLLIHLLTDAEKHEHVVTLCDAHGIQITQNICTSNSSL